jgi:Family of unknown function (DUF6002)
VSATAIAGVVTVVNALAEHHADVQQALHTIGRERHRTHGDTEFVPAFELPALTPELRLFLAASDLAFAPMGEYRGRRLILLDLMRNPRTRTTKTFASLVIVARAVRHIRETGQPVMLLTPSSANKGTALRDAVLRALEVGLAGPQELNIAVVVPAASRAKLWSSPLSTDPHLRQRNPVIVHHGGHPSEVKSLAHQVAGGCTSGLRALNGTNLWYTLNLENYLAADAVRAFVERDPLPRPPGRGRLHVHAVSSAYGLLGHHFGRTLTRDVEAGPPARYLLVQHLDTPDMVLSLPSASAPGADAAGVPAYAYDHRAGVYRQSVSPRFPATTLDPAETVDVTFYTHRPPTSTEMSRLIATSGGGGIVVSLHECLTRYAETRALLGEAGVELPADPRRLREWAVVMAMTGMLNAIDRGLVDEGEDILVHGSGCYTDGDYDPIPAHHLHTARDAADLRRLVCDAALTPVPPDVRGSTGAGMSGRSTAR